MNNHDDELIQERLDALVPAALPPSLRAKVLGKVQRELRGHRRDRRLGQVAGFLLALGIGFSLLIQWQDRGRVQQLGAKTSPDTIVEIAVNLAKTTDTKTARCMALHLSALSGTPFTEQHSAMIDEQLLKRLPHTGM